jgi:DNA-directed RNA polymerase subunit RPC12/RpoP
MDSDVRIKQLVLRRMERCIVCHRHFDQDDISVISREQDMWTMLVACPECHARNYVAAVMNDGNPEEAQLALRRLSERATEDLVATGHTEALSPLDEISSDSPVSAADVVDMYEFLAEFDGDFRALFRK